MRFGLRSGGSAAVSALRCVMGQPLPFAEASIAPRTDGVYLTAAHAFNNKFMVAQFTESEVDRIGSNRPGVRAKAFQAGEVARSRWGPLGTHFVTDEAKPEWNVEFMVLPDDRLVYQRVADSAIPGLGKPTFELTFLPYDGLDDDWGLTVLKTWPADPGWMPVLTSTGQFEAPDVGTIRARAKG